MDFSEGEIAKLVNTFSEGISVPRKKSENPIIVAPYGPSCVGKTTVMRYVAQELGLSHIQNDEIRIFLRNKGIDENEILYRCNLLGRVGEYFLKKGYGIVLDANFATNHDHLLKAKKLAEKYKASFFLIRVIAPEPYVIEKLRNKKFLSQDVGGLLPDAETAIEHFKRSLTQFDYEKLMPSTLTIVDSSEQLEPQLEKSIAIMRGTTLH